MRQESDSQYICSLRPLPLCVYVQSVHRTIVLFFNWVTYRKVWKPLHWKFFNEETHQRWTSKDLIYTRHTPMWSRVSTRRDYSDILVKCLYSAPKRLILHFLFRRRTFLVSRITYCNMCYAYACSRAGPGKTHIEEWWQFLCTWGRYDKVLGMLGILLALHNQVLHVRLPPCYIHPHILVLCMYAHGSTDIQCIRPSIRPYIHTQVEHDNTCCGALILSAKPPHTLFKPTLISTIVVVVVQYWSWITLKLAWTSQS